MKKLSLTKVAKKLPLSHSLPEVLILPRIVINTAQYCQWLYKCSSPPRDVNEMGCIRCHWSELRKLNHFWPSVHRGRSNNNCRQWLNWGGLNWTQSLELNGSHPSKNDSFDRIPWSNCSSGCSAQVMVWQGSFASSYFFFFFNVLLYRVMTEQQHRVGDVQSPCGESGEVVMKDREWEISGRLPGSLGQHSLQFRWRF